VIFRSRRLACSFCGRGEAQVAKLVAGPRVYICDRCAAIAMQIMEAASGDPPRPSAPARGRTLLGRILGRFGRAAFARRRGRIAYHAAR
jgi:hypothetical protein